MDVNFDKSQFYKLLESDPQYEKSMQDARDNKAYERKAKTSFLFTSIMLIVVYYISLVLFRGPVLDTLTGLYRPGNPVAMVIDFLHKTFRSSHEISGFTSNLFNAILSGILFLGIIVPFITFFRRRDETTAYNIETFTDARCYCDECGWAGVDILKTTSSVKINRVKTDRKKKYVPIKNVYIDTISRSTGAKEKSTLKSTTYKVYEYDIFEATYNDTYSCRQCGNITSGTHTEKEFGKDEYITTKDMHWNGNYRDPNLEQA
ncbi:hypothetical protein K7I13_13710 [Brucepastera parasyntrophica]|uniref:hypothetical protein n=1 Tax=Brucepastera parasyntrophica TaxID=2880008 RepID=UPI002108E9ED|nr:hypothetical protein [Brucepastera parasyntrophica]ULQ59507.1 hypothetical protein K7I13_13710 [Brucepastera parasyntrophica]